MAASKFPLVSSLKIIRSTEAEKNGNEDPNLVFDLINLEVISRINHNFSSELKINANIIAHLNRGAVLLNREIIELKTKMPFLTPWKSVKRIHCDLGMLKKCQQQINLYAIECGIYETSKYWKLLQVSDLPLLAFALMPYISLDENKIAPLLLFLYLLLDDILDNDVYYKSTNLTTTDLSQSVGTFVTISNGGSIDAAFMESSPFPHFKPLCGLFSELRKKLLMFGRTNIEGFLNAHSKSIMAAAWETRGWCRNRNEIKTNISAIKREYYYRRELTIGFIPLMELGCLYQKIHLPKEVRIDPLIQRLCRHWSRIAFLNNDFVSIKKDIKNKEIHNMFLLRSFTKGRVAIKKTMDDIYESIAETKYLSDCLRKKLTNTSELAQLNRFIDHGNTACDGNTIYSIFAGRYYGGSFSVDLVYNDHEG